MQLEQILFVMLHAIFYFKAFVNYNNQGACQSDPGSLDQGHIWFNGMDFKNGSLDIWTSNNGKHTMQLPVVLSNDTLLWQVKLPGSGVAHKWCQWFSSTCDCVVWPFLMLLPWYRCCVLLWLLCVFVHVCFLGIIATGCVSIGLMVAFVAYILFTGVGVSVIGVLLLRCLLLMKYCRFAFQGSHCDDDDDADGWWQQWLLSPEGNRKTNSVCYQRFMWTGRQSWVFHFLTTQKTSFSWRFLIL